MATLNQCNFIGRLGKDPECRTAGSSTVCNYSIAVDDSFTNKTTGEKTQKTEWVKCVMWGKLAEIGEKFLKKGGEVFVTGKMQTKVWEKEGVKQYSTEINVFTMQMLGSKGDSQPQAAMAAPVDEESELPF